MRATGKTTRIIDAAIQELFSTGEVEVLDHFVSPIAGLKPSIRAAKIVEKRLKSEHKGVRFSRIHNRIILSKTLN